MTSILDVPGIRVGHAHRCGGGWLSGVSVVLPVPGTIGSVDVRGGGPGTHETDALDPTTLVSTVDAVVLTGGSAYGLAAAGGAQRWCEEHGRGYPVAGGVVPIVPAAAIFDLGRGGNFAARPDAGFGYLAARAAAAAGQDGDGQDGAAAGAIAGAAAEAVASARLGAAAAGADVVNGDVRGNVGAGMGALISRGAYKGGVGSASLTLAGANAGIVVGALAVVNAAGGPADAAGAGPVGAASGPRSPGGPPPNPPAPTLSTTLAVVATNAVLSVAEAKRTATAAHAGLARALVPSHTLVDGDTIFALATQSLVLADPAETDAGSAEAGRAEAAGAGRVAALLELQSAAAEAVRLAILDGIAAAGTVTTPAGTFPAYPRP